MIRAYANFHPKNIHLSLFKACVEKNPKKGDLKNPFSDLQLVINDKNKTLAKKLTFTIAVVMRYMNWKLLLKNQTEQLITALLLQVKVFFMEMAVSKVSPSIHKKVYLKKEDKNFLLGIGNSGFFSSGAHMAINTAGCIESESQVSGTTSLSNSIGRSAFSYSCFWL